MTQQSESQAMAHEATLFVMQMAGDSMINAGIHNGDLRLSIVRWHQSPEMWLRLSWTTKSPSSGWFHGPASPYCTPRIRDTPITCRATALRLLSGASSPMSFTR